MMILGSPEEEAIPIGEVTIEVVPKEVPLPIIVPPAVVEVKIDWGKYIPWIIFGIILLTSKKG